MDEAIRLAKIKEQSVAGLLQKLDTVLESTESQLSCMKCMQILQDPQVMVPCGHAVCYVCSKGDTCPCCHKQVNGKVKSDTLEGLSVKYE